MKRFVIMLSLIIPSYLLFSQQPNAKEIIRKANELMQGESNESTLKMTVVRPNWTRTIGIHTWAKGSQFSMVLITEPAKEKGQTFLKRNNEMWNWIPNIQRMVKLPPSMMSQGWMGSDFTNDELLKESSIVEDYLHTLEGTETISGLECYKIKLVPKPEAAIVWGFVVKWISKEGFFQLKSEYYDEDNLLVKTELASEIRTMGDRKIPTHFELIPADKPGNKTLLDMGKVTFNKAFNDDFFSQQKMKSIR